MPQLSAAAKRARRLGIRTRSYSQTRTSDPSFQDRYDRACIGYGGGGLARAVEVSRQSREYRMRRKGREQGAG